MTTTKSMKARLADNERKLHIIWNRLNQRFPREEDCLKELIRLSKGRAFRCETCKHSDFEKVKGRRGLKCKGCGSIVHPTAGTYFHGIRKPRAWLARIWFFEGGVCISSLRFSKLLRISFSVALNIFRKLTLVIVTAFSEKLMSVRSRWFTSLTFRRSLETPAREHPSSEEQVLEREQQRQQEERDEQESSAHNPTPYPDVSGRASFNHEANTPNGTANKPVLSNAAAQEPNLGGQSLPAVRTTASGETSIALTDEEQMVLNCLSDVAIGLDELCTRTSIPSSKISSSLTILELSGLIASLPGELYVKNFRVRIGMSSKVAIASGASDLSGIDWIHIQQIMKFVRFFFHGVSRKYLQNYLAAYWCR